MIEVNEQHYFPFKPSDVFELVSDVASYPEFVPGVMKASMRPLSPQSFHADLSMGYQFFKEDYSCIVHLTPQSRIDIEYVKGPFNKLQNIWEFRPDGQGVMVQFYMAFEFKSGLLEGVVSSVFKKVVESMIGAFEKRAQELYHPVADTRSRKLASS